MKREGGWTHPCSLQVGGNDVDRVGLGLRFRLLRLPGNLRQRDVLETAEANAKTAVNKG